MSEVAIYQAEDGKTCLEVQLEHDTVWLNQAQLVDLFERDQSVLSRYIRNVFKEGELDEKSNMQKMHITNSDKPVAFYSLDVIISVGSRVKYQLSKRLAATVFIFFLARNEIFIARTAPSGGPTMPWLRSPC